MPFNPTPDLDCRYGAPMGRHGIHHSESTKLHLVRLPFVDGCYDRGGAYWGAPADVWAYGTDDGETLSYLRAKNRAEAKAIVCERVADARFYR